MYMDDKIPSFGSRASIEHGTVTAANVLFSIFGAGSEPPSVGTTVQSVRGESRLLTTFW